MRTLGVVVLSAWALAATASAAKAQENPTTPGAIPNPGSYQGSLELQRRSDEQDQQFRQQQQYQQPQYQQPRYGQPYGRPQAPSRAAPAPERPRESVLPFNGKLSPANQRAMDALSRGDAATAVRIWTPLAAQGDVDAEYNLGVLYDEGRGVPHNPAVAEQLFRKAAGRGMAPAMNNLGVLYIGRAKRPADLVPAYKWFAVVASHARDPDMRASAIKNMRVISPLMSARLIGLAEAQARAWTPS